MKILNEKSIQNLPFHDSDFHGVQIIQTDEGETDLVIDITFYVGEYECLSKDYQKVIKNDGSASILFKNCELIKIHGIYKRAQRDEIDFVQYVSDLPGLKKAMNHVEVVFTSGSRLECVTEKMGLIDLDNAP